MNPEVNAFTHFDELIRAAKMISAERQAANDVKLKQAVMEAFDQRDFELYKRDLEQVHAYRSLLAEEYDPIS